MDSESTMNEQLASPPIDMRRWHVVKGIPLTTLFMMAAQIAAFIWYAALFSFEQRQQGSRIANLEVKVDRVIDNTNNSLGPVAANNTKITYLESQVNQLRERVEALRDALALRK